MPTPQPVCLCPRPYDISSQGYNNWVFMSTHFWDEDPRGMWTLGLENKGYYFNTGESGVHAGLPPSPQLLASCYCLHVGFPNKLAGPGAQLGCRQ